MKNYIFLLCCISLGTLAEENTFNVDDWARENLGSVTETRFLLSSDLTQNTHYLIDVVLPNSYQSAPKKHYPVLYLLDSYWDKTALSSMLDFLMYDKYVPEMIIVGIGYPGDTPDYNTLRQIDYTPTKHTFNDNSGDAKAFLAFIEHQLIPKIESDFRVDTSFRGLAGASLGGLFSLYSMFERPELFQGHIASSPAILWGRRWIMQREIDYFWGDSNELWLDEAQNTLPTRLFMTVGSLETEINWINEAKAFDNLIASRGYEGFSYEFHVLQGFHHGGVKYPTFARGLPFIFKGYRNL